VSRCIKLAVFTFFTAFVFGFIISENAQGMGLYGTDESGRQVNVIDVDKYLKQNPYRPPARKPAPKPKPKPVAKKPAPKAKPVAKKPAPKPAPKPEIKQYVPKPVPKGGNFSEFKVDTLVGEAVVGGAISTAMTGTPVPGAIGGAGHVTGMWLWNNKKEIAKEYKKISVLEDPMGKSFPH
tara:strand:+ start:82 stop:621 length:540 start_codon:yes stop_codon:yes gene_type:complete